MPDSCQLLIYNFEPTQICTDYFLSVFLRFFFRFFRFELDMDCCFSASSRSTFFSARYAVISKYPEELNLSDFFISVEYHLLPDRISYLRLTALRSRHSCIHFGTSHPIACDGCYHARTVAGGESQLSVFIANQVLLDFSEDGIVRSS